MIYYIKYKIDYIVIYKHYCSTKNLQHNSFIYIIRTVIAQCSLAMTVKFHDLTRKSMN